MSDHPARRLFDVAPSAYVDERTRLAKEVRAAGHRELAKALQALKRPTLAMWAVVAGGADAELVHELYEATEALGRAQSRGERDATVAATRRRKDAVGAVTSAAVAALRIHEPSAEARRPEIRTMVDQLSRHPGLAAAWVDGTLRELPDDDGFGFAAFAGLELTPSGPAAGRPAPDPAAADRPVDEPPAPRPRRLRSVPDAPPDAQDAPARDPERERAERAARAARAAERRDAIRARDRAASSLVTAEKRLAGAEELFRRAEADLRAAEAEHAAAVARHTAAVERVESLADE